MTRAPILLATLLLAGCGEPAPAPTNKIAAAPKESGYIARVRALPPGQLNGVLFRAIQASGGQSCQGVTRVEPGPPVPSGEPVWRVACAEGGQWRVVLQDDGTALVTGAQR
jgi:hypothetical protein